MAATKECPACGGQSCTSSQQTSVAEVPYGPPVPFIEVVDTCATCQETGDFDGVSDKPRFAAIVESRRLAVSKIVAELAELGVSHTYIERALQLNFGSIKSWARSEPPAEGYSLLCLVRTYPWLLMVADDNYNEEAAARALFMAALDTQDGGLLPPE